MDDAAFRRVPDHLEPSWVATLGKKTNGFDGMQELDVVSNLQPTVATEILAKTSFLLGIGKSVWKTSFEVHSLELGATKNWIQFCLL